MVKVTRYHRWTVVIREWTFSRYGLDVSGRYYASAIMDGFSCSLTGEVWMSKTKRPFAVIDNRGIAASPVCRSLEAVEARIKSEIDLKEAQFELA